MVLNRCNIYLLYLIYACMCWIYWVCCVILGVFIFVLLFGCYFFLIDWFIYDVVCSLCLVVSFYGEF